MAGMKNLVPQLPKVGVLVYTMLLFWMVSDSAYAFTASKKLTTGKGTDSLVHGALFLAVVGPLTLIVQQLVKKA